MREHLGMVFFVLKLLFGFLFILSVESSSGERRRRSRLKWLRQTILVGEEEEGGLIAYWATEEPNLATVTYLVLHVL